MKEQSLFGDVLEREEGVTKLPRFVAALSIAGMAFTTVAHASLLSVSKTICVHKYVETPQIVEVLYTRPDQAYPCRVYYTKANERTMQGRWNNNPNGCERVEANIVTNLVQGGFECEHELIKIPADPDHSLTSDVFRRFDRHGPAEANYGVVLDRFTKEDDAQIYASAIKRKLPFIEVRIAYSEQEEMPFIVMLAAERTEASARQLARQVEDFSLAFAEPIDIAAIDRGASRYRPVGNDWQRYAVAACFEEGSKSPLTLAKCTGLRVDQETLSKCILGGLCQPPEIRLSLDELIGDLPTDLSDIPIEVDTQIVADIEACYDVGLSHAAFEKCGVEKMLSPEAKNLLECGASFDSQTEFLRCASKNELDDQTRALVNCVDPQGAGGTIASCLADNIPDEKSRIVVGCIAEDGEDFEDCLVERFADQGDIGRAAKCIDDYGEDSTSAALCVAKDHMSDDQREAVECWSRSESVEGFAVCAFADDLGLTPEQQIVAECAISSAGEPISFASCAGGRLTIRELKKCLSGKIGGKDGCFGENNTIVKIARNAASDIKDGPGENNELVRFRETILRGDNGEVARFLRDPYKRPIEIVSSVAKDITDTVVGDIRNGPGDTNDIVGKNGWLRKRLGF